MHTHSHTHKYTSRWQTSTVYVFACACACLFVCDENASSCVPDLAVPPLALQPPPYTRLDCLERHSYSIPDQGLFSLLRFMRARGKGGERERERVDILFTFRLDAAREKKPFTLPPQAVIVIEGTLARTTWQRRGSSIKCF